MKLLRLCIAVLGALLSSNAFGATFVNGDFETGNATGWTIGGGFRASVDNATLSAAQISPGGALYDASIANSHSAIVTAGTDPNTSGGLNRVYSGTYSWRVEDTSFGGYASVISQQVNNYTDPSIFFAWAAVLEGAHGSDDAATMKIFLTDLTAGDQLVARQYNAGSAGSGVDARFNYDASTNYYWTPWQIEQITLPSNRIGHNFLLSVLASDCQPTGHTGYVYLDGFGSVNPPPVNAIPEPASVGLVAAGLGALVIRSRRRSA